LPTCSHIECDREETIWLPSLDEGNGDIKKHTWCKNCGIVKNISDDRPKKIGYWMNKLSILSSELSLKQCQKRLIAKKIESCESFIDLFGTFGSDQKELFIDIVLESVHIRLSEIESIIS
jgi:hypothetical protein